MIHRAGRVFRQKMTIAITSGRHCRIVGRRQNELVADTDRARVYRAGNHQQGIPGRFVCCL